ncbi:MAG: S8 family serine peptidase [Phycisphaeraceae bacterium]|nr:S8 family serine peptidase [Phycisphaeraceae bacterium]
MKWYSAAVCVSLVATSGAIGDSNASGLSYRYFKESRPLQLDPLRIAVFEAAPGASRNIGAIAGQQIPIPGWSLVATDAAHRSPLSIAAIAADPDTQRGLEFISPVFVGEDGGPLIVTRDVFVGFDESVTPERARAVIASSGIGEILDEAFAGTLGLYRVRTASKDGFEVLSAANELADSPEVRFAEPDMIFTGHGDIAPNDPLFPLQWALRNTGQFAGGVPGADMEALRAWDITTGSSSIITVVLDVGVDLTHPDLNQRFPGIDTTGTAGGTGGPMNSCDKHGTSVAGCISEKMNNALGGSGLAPETRTASARAFIANTACDGSWSSTASYTVTALQFASDIGARVTNNSNYYGFSSSTISNKYNATKAAGIVHFASAGNNATSSLAYPASIPSVNAIAALGVNGLRASFSQYGTGLAYSAPGSNIYSTDIQGSGGYDPGSDYVSVSGTSFASPLSAAAAALVLSYKPALTSEQVELALAQGARDVGAPGYDTGYGYGFVDAYRALERIRCPADLTFDDVVEDGDFVFFVQSYNVLLCADPSMPLLCSADLNGDGVVDDADFVIFVQSYDALLCS